jgi:hypothetical protein
MKRLILLLPLILLGCGDPPMKNEDIIKEVARCKSAGFDAVEFKNQWGGPYVITRIQCKQVQKGE